MTKGRHYYRYEITKSLSMGWDIIPNGFTNLVAFHPRFGGGVFWDLFPQISLRGEISHEFIGVGGTFMF